MRHPAASPLLLTDIRYYEDLARRAEAALFDSIFLADQLALGDHVTTIRSACAARNFALSSASNMTVTGGSSVRHISRRNELVLIPQAS